MGGEDLGQVLGAGREQPVVAGPSLEVGGQVLLPDGPEDELEGGLAGLDHPPGRAQGRVGRLTGVQGEGAQGAGLVAEQLAAG
jgi:hypothetical protein